jgi:hypothetical protein
MHRATRRLWPHGTVNTRVAPVPMVDSRGRPVLDDHGRQKMEKPSIWLSRERGVDTLTWLPGASEVILDQIVVEGGFLTKPGARIYNTYLPPTVTAGNPRKARRWIKHIYRLWPKEAKRIIYWLAHRVQFPGIKPNHGLVLVGPPGIGKDTILVPMRDAVGAANFVDVSLKQIASGQFNGYLMTVILRVNEARDSGDAGGKIDRYTLHDHMKPMFASPPETWRINLKNVKEFKAFNVVGVIVTSNHEDALYLTDDDRRTLVAISPCQAGQFPTKFFDDFYRWYEKEGGIGDVVALLQQLDLAKFNPFATPPKTEGFRIMVAVDYGPEHAELMDALDALGRAARDKAVKDRGEPPPTEDTPFERPEAVTLDDIASKAAGADWLRDRKQARVIPHHMRRAGYERVIDPEAVKKDGLWQIKNRRVAIYARAELPAPERLEAARRYRKHGPVHDRKAAVNVAVDNTTTMNDAVKDRLKRVLKKDDGFSE